MNRKMIRADKANTGTKLGATHLSKINGDLIPACETPGDGWHEVSATWTFEADGETFTYATTVDCKKCRKFVR